MKKAIVDTGFLLSIAHDKDELYEDAKSILDQSVKKGVCLLVTTTVLTEYTHLLLKKRKCNKISNSIFTGAVENVIKFLKVVNSFHENEIYRMWVNYRIKFGNTKVEYADFQQFVVGLEYDECDFLFTSDSRDFYELNKNIKEISLPPSCLKKQYDTEKIVIIQNTKTTILRN